MVRAPAHSSALKALPRSSGFALLNPAEKPQLDPARILTMSGTIAVNLLALGMLFMLIVLALDATLGISGSRSFSWFFTTYNAGLVITAGALTWHGLLQVFGQAAGAAIAGIAGLGHILLTIGIGCLLVAINKPLRARLADAANV